MGRIIELQDEVRGYQNGLVEKMNERLDQMTQRIIEKNEAIGEKILENVNEEIMMLKLQLGRIEAKLEGVDNNGTEVMEEVASSNKRIEGIRIKLTNGFGELSNGFGDINPLDLLEHNAEVDDNDSEMNVDSYNQQAVHDAGAQRAKPVKAARPNDWKRLAKIFFRDGNIELN